MPFSLMKQFDISVLMTDELRAFLQGAHPDPFRILGPHRLRDDVLVRVFRPDAREVSIKLNHNGSVVPAEKIQGEGLFQATLEKCPRDVFTPWKSNGGMAVNRSPETPIPMA